MRNYRAEAGRLLKQMFPNNTKRENRELLNFGFGLAASPMDFLTALNEQKRRLQA